jgi:hypothetical protein
MASVRPIPSNTKVIAYNRKDVVEGNSKWSCDCFKPVLISSTPTQTTIFMWNSEVNHSSNSSGRSSGIAFDMSNSHSTRAEFRDVTELLGLYPGLDARLIYNKRERLRTCIREKVFKGFDLNDNDDPEVEAAYAEELEVLALLLDYIESEFVDVTTQLDSLTVQKEGHSTWNLLWTLCEKGTRMESVDNESGDLCAFELKSWNYKEKADKKPA